jgi:hypothetical protein
LVRDDSTLDGATAPLVRIVTTGDSAFCVIPLNCAVAFVLGPLMQASLNSAQTVKNSGRHFVLAGVCHSFRREKRERKEEGKKRKTRIKPGRLSHDA